MRWMLHGKWNCQIWGGTVLVDGTSKWEVRKIGNAEELNGQAIEDFKNELLAAVPEQKIYSTVLLSSGEICYMEYWGY